MSNFWKTCLNPKVIVGVVAVAVGVLLFAPHLAASALPVLFVAICPLSMLFMMRSMQGEHSSTPEERAPSPTDPVSADHLADLHGAVTKLRERQADVEQELVRLQDLEQQLVRLERGAADEHDVPGSR